MTARLPSRTPPAAAARAAARGAAAAADGSAPGPGSEPEAAADAAADAASEAACGAAARPPAEGAGPPGAAVAADAPRAVAGHLRRAAAGGASGGLETDSPLEGGVAGQTDLMAYPFFGLSKTPSHRGIRFVEGPISVEVRPSEKGVATIWDKEILIYLASLAIERLERGGTFDGVLTFTAYDFFKLAGLSGASGKNYQRLAGSLDRLQGTQVRTTIETGGVNIDGWFSWVSEAQVMFVRDSAGQKRARAFRVRITDWLVRAIAADGSVLSYDRGYFQLPAIERRLYEIARAGCARGEPLTMGLATLRSRIGVTSPLKKFRQLLAQIAERDDLPAYRIEMLDGAADGAARAPLTRIRVRLTPRDLAEETPIAPIAGRPSPGDGPAQRALPLG